MSSIHVLSHEQKIQVRNAFTLICNNSEDGTITVSNLANVYQMLDMEVPSEKVLQDMLGGKDSLNFAQFTQIITGELSKLDDRTTIAKALRVFSTEEDDDNLNIDLETLKDACCSVQLGEIGSGDHRLSSSSFDSLVEGFVREEMNGRKVFQGSLWLEAYIE